MSFAAITQMFLAVIFILSSVLKILDRGAFEKVLGELLASTRLVQAGALLIPAAELLGGILLLVKGWEFIGQIIVLCLIAGFGWAHWSILSRKKRVVCNCFGSFTADTFGWRSAARVCALFVLVVYLLMSGDSKLYETAFIDVANATLMSVGILSVYSLLTIAPSRGHS